MNDRISIILPEDLKKDIEQLLAEKHVDQSTLIRELLFRSVKEAKLQHALDEYRKGKLSFGKAAEYAGITLWEFIEETNHANIPLKLSIIDAENEILKISDGYYDQFIP